MKNQIMYCLFDPDGKPFPECGISNTEKKTGKKVELITLAPLTFAKKLGFTIRKVEVTIKEI